MALPCGSRTPVLSVTLMRAFMLLASVRLGADQHGATALGTRVLGENAQAPRHFLIGLQHAAEIAAEAVLVQLVGGRGVPETAAIGADLVGQHDAHLLVLPQPP